MVIYRQCYSICDACADAINDENEDRIVLRARIAELESEAKRLRERCVGWLVRYGEQRIEAEQLRGLLRKVAAPYLETICDDPDCTCEEAQLRRTIEAVLARSVGERRLIR
jgi:hypothetical protein